MSEREFIKLNRNINFLRKLKSQNTNFQQVTKILFRDMI